MCTYMCTYTYIYIHTYIHTRDPSEMKKCTEQTYRASELGPRADASIVGYGAATEMRLCMTKQHSKDIWVWWNILCWLPMAKKEKLLVSRPDCLSMQFRTQRGERSTMSFQTQHRPASPVGRTMTFWTQQQPTDKAIVCTLLLQVHASILQRFVPAFWEVAWRGACGRPHDATLDSPIL